MEIFSSWEGCQLYFLKGSEIFWWMALGTTECIFFFFLLWPAFSSFSQVFSSVSGCMDTDSSDDTEWGLATAFSWCFLRFCLSSVGLIQVPHDIIPLRTLPTVGSASTCQMASFLSTTTTQLMHIKCCFEMWAVFKGKPDMITNVRCKCFRSVTHGQRPQLSTNLVNNKEQHCTQLDTNTRLQ